MRLDAYLRVSDRGEREGDRYIAFKQQRDEIQRWAEYRKHEIVEWWEEENVSGGKTDRPCSTR